MFPFKKIIASSVILASFVALTACSSTGSGANNGNAAAEDAANANGVQTAGIGGQNGVNNTGLSNPNAMVPGANQSYFFDFNKSDVHASDLPSIKVQSQYLTAHPNKKILIEGNTDIRGSREYNIALGARRANAVENVFKLDGANAKQMRTISFGAEKPRALGKTEQDYAMNRRADVIYQGEN